MKESEIRVNCASHGESDGAFVCKHLVDGDRLGFNWGVSEEDPDKTSPDAWCNACDAARESAGGWTDDAATIADIKLVCKSCYSLIRARNWIQDDEAYEKLLDASIGFYNEKMNALKAEFRIGDHKRYDWNQDTAQLIFSNDGKPAVICDVVFVGSVSKKSDTWLWSWANESHSEHVKAGIRKVRTYGEQHCFEKLAGAYWPAKEPDGWQMAAISTYLLDGIGAYRSPGDNSYLFMVVMAARWAT